MFKWLDKVISGANGKAEADAAPAPVASRPAPAKPKEKPLDAPRITSDNLPGADDYANGILIRKVLVDRAYHPVAYEFTLQPDSTRHGENEAALIIGLLGRLGTERLSATRQTWVRMTDRDLDYAGLAQLPADRVVLVIRVAEENPPKDEERLQRARQLRAKGFRLALTEWQDSTFHRAWLAVCHYVEVDLDRELPIDVNELPERLKSLAPGIDVVAVGVDSYEELEFCFRANYTLFRGGFLTRRENWPRQPKINPERARICQLLNKLHGGAELRDIAAQIKQSPELSYRLLRYINSAGMGLMIPVASVQQGLIILGRDKTYRWLTVLLFSAAKGKSIDSALLEQALLRARLMELLGKDRFNRVQSEELFVVGIFSQIDMLLKLPMSVALEPLKLPEPVYEALVNDAGDYAPYLQIAILGESDDPTALRLASQRAGLTMAAVNSAQLEAMQWVQETLAD
ncbi:MAG TPA: HDOD domain-containing protein [Rhodocyclaceae bacterium]|nr:HDOD domain-containing protein [Rhodocyclaceae bacterium]